MISVDKWEHYQKDAQYWVWMLVRPKQPSDWAFWTSIYISCYFWIQITADVSKNFSRSQRYSSCRKGFFLEMYQQPETFFCKNYIFTYLQLVVFDVVNLILLKCLKNRQTPHKTIFFTFLYKYFVWKGCF